MKTLLKVMALVLLVSSIGSANTGTGKKRTVKKNPDSQLGTNFRFDGTALHGKYQSSPSTVATVENDKFLEDLLGVRKSFKDRAKEDNERN